MYIFSLTEIIKYSLTVLACWQMQAYITSLKSRNMNSLCKKKEKYLNLHEICRFYLGQLLLNKTSKIHPA